MRERRQGKAEVTIYEGEKEAPKSIAETGRTERKGRGRSDYI